MTTVDVTISSATNFATKAVSVAYTFLGGYSWLEVDEGTVNLTGRADFKKPGVYEVILRAASSDERERCLYVGKARTVLGRRIVEKLVHGKSVKDHPYTQLVLADAEEAARARGVSDKRELLLIRCYGCDIPSILEMSLHLWRKPEHPDKELFPVPALLYAL